jgi:hypothetical protein
MCIQTGTQRMCILALSFLSFLFSPDVKTRISILLSHRIAQSWARRGAWLDCEPASRRTFMGAPDTTDALGVGEGDLIPMEFRRDATHAESNHDRFALLNRQSRE